MYGFIKRDVLRTFILTSLLFELSGALGQPADSTVGEVMVSETVTVQEITVMKVQENTVNVQEETAMVQEEVVDTRKELAIIAPKDENRTYSTEVLENGIEMILVKDPDEEEIVLRVIIGWGDEYGKKLWKQIGNFLLDRPSESGVEAPQWKCKVSACTHPYYAQLEIRTDENHLKRDVSSLFRYFDVRKDMVDPDVTAEYILDRIAKGKELSPEELEVFFKEIFLRSKITFMVYGNVLEENLKQIRLGISGIRSSVEREISDSEAISRRVAFDERFEDFEDDLKNGCRMMITVPSGSSLSHTGLLEAVTRIIMSKIGEDKTMRDMTEKCGDIRIISKVMRVNLQGKDTTSAKLIITVLSKKILENYATVLKGLFSCFKKLIISEEECKKFINSMKEKFESEVPAFSVNKIMNTLSVGSVSWPVEKYLNFFYEFEGLKHDEVNKVLQDLVSDIEKWNIALISSGRRTLLNKEDIFKEEEPNTKTKPENPEVPRGDEK